jgi:hypothetical protein
MSKTNENQMEGGSGGDVEPSGSFATPAAKQKVKGKNCQRC